MIGVILICAVAGGALAAPIIIGIRTLWRGPW